MPDLRDRLMRRFEQKNITAAELARRVGVNPQNVQHWMRRDRVPGDKVFRVADVLDCSVEWLATGRGPESAEDSIAVPRSKYQQVPFLLDPGRFLAVSTDIVGPLVDDLESIRVYEARDSSMEPLILRGGLVLVDQSFDAPAENRVMVMGFAGAHKIRRVFLRADGSVVISSEGDPDRYPTDTIPADLVAEVDWLGAVFYACGPVE